LAEDQRRDDHRRSKGGRGRPEKRAARGGSAGHRLWILPVGRSGFNAGRRRARADAGAAGDCGGALRGFASAALSRMSVRFGARNQHRAHRDTV